MESGQVIPLHVAYADNLADFGTALVCLYVTHSMLHIDCYTWHVAHCTSQNMNMIQHSVIECGKDVFLFLRQNTSYLVTFAFCHVSENLPLRCLFYDTVNIYFYFLC